MQQVKEKPESSAPEALPRDSESTVVGISPGKIAVIDTVIMSGAGAAELASVSDSLKTGALISLSVGVVAIIDRFENPHTPGFRFLRKSQ